MGVRHGRRVNCWKRSGRGLVRVWPKGTGTSTRRRVGSMGGLVSFVFDGGGSVGVHERSSGRAHVVFTRKRVEHWSVGVEEEIGREIVRSGRLEGVPGRTPRESSPLVVFFLGRCRWWLVGWVAEDQGSVESVPQAFHPIRHSRTSLEPRASVRRSERGLFGMKDG